jgi:hypothetical protein
MKRFLSTIALLTLTLNLYAQDYYKTSLATPRKKGLSVSGFSGGAIEFSAFRGQTLVMAGGGGAALFNRHFFVGGFGQRTITPTSFAVGRTTYNAHVTQGGLWLGYLSGSAKRVALQFDTRLGWARTGLATTTLPSDQRQYRNSGLLVTPSVGLQIKAAPFMRINLSGGYRFANRVDVALSDTPGFISDRLTNRDFNGATGSISLLFGNF